MRQCTLNVSSQDASPRSYSKEIGSRDDNDVGLNTLASEHTWAEGSLVAQAKDLHILSTTVAAKYSVNMHRFQLVRKLSVWHRQFWKSKKHNDERNDDNSEKALPGILHIKSPPVSNMFRK